MIVHNKQHQSCLLCLFLWTLQSYAQLNSMKVHSRAHLLRLAVKFFHSSAQDRFYIVCLECVWYVAQKVKLWKEMCCFFSFENLRQQWIQCCCFFSGHSSMFSPVHSTSQISVQCNLLSIGKFSLKNIFYFSSIVNVTVVMLYCDLLHTTTTTTKQQRE